MLNHTQHTPGIRVQQDSTEFSSDPQSHHSLHGLRLGWCVQWEFCLCSWSQRNKLHHLRTGETAFWNPAGHENKSWWLFCRITTVELFNLYLGSLLFNKTVHILSSHKLQLAVQSNGLFKTVIVCVCALWWTGILSSVPPACAASDRLQGPNNPLLDKQL